MRQGNSAMFIVLLLLFGGVVYCLATDGARSAAGNQAASEFQQIVGGLGLGPAADWSRCGHSFDSRFSDQCVCDDGPLLGRSYFCPHAAGSVFLPRSPSGS